MRLLQFLIENPQLAIILAGAFVYWLGERRKAKARKELGGEPLPQELDSDEGTREVQEEIRRKIAERQGRPQPAAPVPELSPRAPAVPPALPEPVRPATLAEVEAPGSFALEQALEQQRRYAQEWERLEAVQREREAAAAQVAQVEAPPAVAAQAARSAGAAAAVRGQLHEREALRRAVVLREVLGAPKALQ